MTINGLWRFGYYKIFSGKSMEDIPIGFGIKIGDRDILPAVGKRDSNVSQGTSKIDISELHSSGESKSIGMHIINPMSTTNEDISNQEENVNHTTQDVMRNTGLESILSVTQSKLSETESKLTEVLHFKSETENQLNQTNAMLNECLTRLAQLEKSDLKV
jgi:hypothetical protein